MSNQTFNLVDFATTATPDVAATFNTYPGDTFPDGSYNATAACHMHVSVAQNLFQFWTDSYDMCDNTLSDIMYKLQYDASAGWNANPASAHPLTTEFLKATNISVNSTPSMNPDNNPYITVPDDYLRYIAHNLFNTTRGVDLFNNEENVLNSINNQSKIALHNLLITMLQGAGASYVPYIYDVSNNEYTSIDANGNPSGFIGNFPLKNPSSKLLRQIMLNVPSRLSDLSSNYAIAGTKWVKMPLIAGDTIIFLVTINSPFQQNSLTSAPAISARTYKIVITIVSDATTLNAGTPYPARP